MRSADWRFIFVQILSLVTLLAFISLGFWQMGRGNVKSDIEAANSQTTNEYIAVQLPLADIEKWRYKQIKLVGKYDSSMQFLLDNQVRDKVTGYNVLTPMYVQAQNLWVLVDRGWLPQARSRDELPNVDITQHDPLTINASVYVPYDKAYSLGGIAEGEDSGWPRRIQFVDYQLLSERLGVPLQPFTLRLARDEKFGYRRDWTAYSMSAQKHYGYAFQWFAMACAVVVLWWLYSIKPLLIKK